MPDRPLGCPRLPLRVVLAWFVATAAIAAPPPDVASGDRFTATLTTRETFRFDRKRCPGWPHLTGTTAAVGTAVPFGPITGRGTDCIRPTGAVTFAFSRGRLTMTTPDGAALFADYSGRLVRSSALRSDRIVGTFAITGGTGRFAGVTGSGTIDGSENLLTRRGRLVLEGAIRR